MYISSWGINPFILKIIFATNDTGNCDHKLLLSFASAAQVFISLCATWAAKENMYEDETQIGVLGCWYFAREDMFLLTEEYCNIRDGDCGEISRHKTQVGVSLTGASLLCKRAETAMTWCRWMNEYP